MATREGKEGKEREKKGKREGKELWNLRAFSWRPFSHEGGKKWAYDKYIMFDEISPYTYQLKLWFLTLFSWGVFFCDSRVRSSTGCKYWASLKFIGAFDAHLSFVNQSILRVTIKWQQEPNSVQLISHNSIGRFIKVEVSKIKSDVS